MNNYEKMNIMVTGGCGFIGSNFINYTLEKYENISIVNVDKLTYASSLSYINNTHNNYTFYEMDICNPEIKNIIINENIKMIFNFAAESHVDKSNNSSMEFIHSNVEGVANLLECSKDRIDLFVQISTDEVYGSTNSTKFTEESIISPRNIYSSSKASAEMLVKSFHNVHDTNYIITRSCNNYGPNQNSEKFIPSIINWINKGEKIKLYGDGENIREWIHVNENIQYIWKIIDNKKWNDTYNITSQYSISNINLVKKLKYLLDIKYEFIEDRKGHDFGYLCDNKKIDDLKIVKYEGLISYILNSIDK